MSTNRQDIFAVDKKAAGIEVGLSQTPPSLAKKREGEIERGETQNGLFCYVLIRSCHLLTPLHFTTQELDAATNERTVDNLGEQKGSGSQWPPVQPPTSPRRLLPWLIRTVSLQPYRVPLMVGYQSTLKLS